MRSVSDRSVSPSHRPMSMRSPLSKRAPPEIAYYEAAADTDAQQVDDARRPMKFAAVPAAAPNQAEMSVLRSSFRRTQPRPNPSLSCLRVLLAGVQESAVRRRRR